MSLALPAGGPRSLDLDGTSPAAEVTARQVGLVQISELAAWLRTQTSPKTKRPFAEQTITGYSEAARALDRWMESQGIEGDFTACDVAMLNRFFAGYHAEHGQHGTNNRQRNLHHLFKWLPKSYGHPDPWASDELVRYGAVKSSPSTLAEDFIRDLLAVTGDGKARKT